MTEISTKLEYPKIDEVLKNWKKMSTWGKNWLVYENEGKKIQYFVVLKNINAIDKSLTFDVIHYKDNIRRYFYDSTFDIFMREDITQKIFESKIFSKIFSILKDLENTAIIRLDESKKLFDEYINKRDTLIFEYHNSQVLKKNRLLNIKDITCELIHYYTFYGGQLYEQDQALYKPYHDFINSQKYNLWKDVYKHFISLIPYEDVREKYTKIIEGEKDD